jgi:uncharacterized protein
MRNPPLASVVALLATIALGFTAGCSLVPEAKSDPTRFYVLSSQASSASAPRADGPSLRVEAVELASYLRSPPVIVRRGGNEIEFREFARWGEPLDVGIGRVLREELLGSGAFAAVSAAGSRREALAADYALSVRVLACEGGASGTALFRAVWDLTKRAAEAAPQTVAHGDFRPTDLRWDGKSEASLAAVLSQAVAGLAAEISAAVPKK